MMEKAKESHPTSRQGQILPHMSELRMIMNIEKDTKTLPNTMMMSNVIATLAETELN